MFTLIIEMLTLEADRCTHRRLQGKLTIKPSSVILLIFAFFYAASPVDFIPEAFINSWAAYIDDVLVCAGALCYAIADLTSALEGRRMGKNSGSAEPNNIQE